MQHADYPPPRALTVRQPNASAFFYADPAKDVENRSWPTAYRGPLFIHAAMRDAPHWQRSAMAGALAAIPAHARAVHGAIIGLVELTGCVRDSGSPWAIPGRWHWTIEPVFPMLDIAERGQLNLWVPQSAWLRPGKER